MNIQQNQTYRVLSMYDRLCKGHVLTKKAEADVFNVGEKTIQRDIDSIRAFLEKEKTNQYLVYDRKQKGYRLEMRDEPFLRNEEILAIVKILIESRAFPKEIWISLLIN